MEWFWQSILQNSLEITMWGWRKKNCDDPRAALKSRFLFPRCWMSSELQYTTCLLGKRCARWDCEICLYCAHTHPPLATENRNNPWKSRGVYEKKEEKQQHILHPRQSHKHLVPSTGAECSLLCLQMCCSRCGWCWEKPDALRILLSP